MQFDDCDQRQFFSKVDRLCKLKGSKALPRDKSDKNLADRFSDFFVGKNQKIVASLQDSPGGNFTNVDSFHSHTLHKLDSFTPMQQCSIMQLIKKSRSTTCGLDPLPTTLLNKCSDELPPVITQIVNLSLQTAQVSPLLKANRMDPELLKNYRPIAQFKFLGKIIERVVLSQVLEYLSSHNLFPSMQSAYRPRHSCETALLRVSNDILLALDGGDEAILLLLDYSAAFDIIKHEAFLSRLEKRYGICDVALSWFKSYFQHRSQSVVIGNSESNNTPVDYGVPQGSVIGPLVFALFAAPLQDIIKHHGIQCMTYADDTQIYILLQHNDRSSAIHRLQSCVSDIKLRSASNGMKLNDDKTEILHFTNKFRMCPQIDSVFLGSSTIATVETARNLGIITDRFLTMSKHVSNICKAASFALHKIGTLRQFLSQAATENLVHALIMPRIDFCNSLLYGLSDMQISKLQRIQNSAAIG